MILFSDDLFVRETIHSTIQELKGFTWKIFELIGMKLEEITTRDRQALATFCFGALKMINQSEKYNQPQVHAIAIEVLLHIFKYSEQQAIVFAEELIVSAVNNRAEEMNGIINKGIKGYYQYVERADEDLRCNVIEILERVAI
ncbi:Imm48 family immunity protein [Bacillus massiliigorillae]|uniref:Imm48 family immunity protein n=1 Tax=Bacillus massiliigorillae TaxID=1243664 RepID=UPI00039E90D1|nr:Imm48 family immunity protein [Bacillus massiliigorillae]